jgi:hypothetical protein
MRSIVRRDSGESYEEFLRRLAEESGMATPTREELAKLDRKRAKKGGKDFSVTLGVRVTFLHPALLKPNYW